MKANSEFLTFLGNSGTFPTMRKAKDIMVLERFKEEQKYIISHKFHSGRILEPSQKRGKKIPRKLLFSRLFLILYKIRI